MIALAIFLTILLVLCGCAMYLEIQRSRRKTLRILNDILTVKFHDRGDETIPNSINQKFLSPSSFNQNQSRNSSQEVCSIVNNNE